MALQEIGDLDGAALEFSDGKGYGPEDVDSIGWILLHHAAVQSQHRRGMLDVVRGLLEAMPVEVVDQVTGVGTPVGWSALSLVCNARDPHNERTATAELLVESRANLEVRGASGATPLITACAAGFTSVVKVLLDAGANPFATNDRGKNALDSNQAVAADRQVFLRKNHIVAQSVLQCVRST